MPGLEGAWVGSSKVLKEQGLEGLKGTSVKWCQVLKASGFSFFKSDPSVCHLDLDTMPAELPGSYSDCFSGATCVLVGLNEFKA